MTDVIVVGGGAAGMMAAVSAAEEGSSVILLERNEKLGKKIYITGKGRGNLTNACDVSDFFDNVITNPRFLYSAIYSFDNTAVMDFFESYGTHLKQERGGRVFPRSDHASDITKALTKALKDLGVEVRLNTRVTELCTRGNAVTGVKLEDGSTLLAGLVIVATGGCSYTTTGSTGDGYRFAESLGLRVIPPVPALVPLVSPDEDIPQLQGLSLKNVTLDIHNDKRRLYSGFGEMLFTHFGISGPLVLTASSLLTRVLNKGQTFTALIDFKPAISMQELDKRFVSIIQENPRKSFTHFFDGVMPRKLIPVLVKRSRIETTKKLSELTKTERRNLVELSKCFTFPITATGGFKEAIITQGGIDVRELDPGTMRAKKVTGLAFAGEVIDVDAKTGGFNMQIAFSTGHLSGQQV